MLDITFIRENANKVRTAAEQKGLNPDVVDEVLRLDDSRRDLLTRIEKLRAERNRINRDLKKERNDELIEESRQLKQKLQDEEPELKRVEAAFQEMMLRIPNVPSEDVPVGADESGNVTVDTWGEKPTFDFEPKDHIELGTALDIIDLERGSKVAGFRGYFLKNEGVLMHLGVMRYALDKMIEQGFSPFVPPIIDRKEAFVNSGHFPWGEQTEVYALQDDTDEQPINDELGENYIHAEMNLKAQHYLAGTAEVPMVSYHAGETLDENDLPLLYCGFSPCYRAEVGSYGRDTRGVYRVHEFMKIEQIVLCKNDIDESIRWHEKLRQYSQEMLQELGLPYRVLLMCTGDMGEPQIKKYDIEAWMPGRDEYGETMSDSIMGDFQSRRANIRYRSKDGGLKFVHMLNNTALASPRILVALWEHYQQKDGSIVVPEVLQKYVGFEKIPRG